MWTGRPRLRGTRDDRNVVRVTGRLTGDRLLQSIFRHRRVIQTRSQRQIGCRATSSSGSREMSVDRETQMTITRREILHRVPQRLKLTEQQSWQDIAQSKGMTYLQRLPEAIPEGQFLVHNSVRPTHPLGSQFGGGSNPSVFGPLLWLHGRGGSEQRSEQPWSTSQLSGSL
jgi:hypothetical protein